MKESMETVLRRKEELMAMEEGLLEKARVFFAKGFKSPDLTPSQMSGVGERVKSSTSIQEAKSTVLKFLDRQLTKLEIRKERSGKVESWLTMSKDEGVDLPLGRILGHWIKEEKYLEDMAITDEIGRLQALQRFWNNVYGHYRYQKAFGKGMPIKEEPS